mgnify:CR=1 FL=1
MELTVPPEKNVDLERVLHRLQLRLPSFVLKIVYLPNQTVNQEPRLAEWATVIVGRVSIVATKPQRPPNLHLCALMTAYPNLNVRPEEIT